MKEDIVLLNCLKDAEEAHDAKGLLLIASMGLECAMLVAAKEDPNLSTLQEMLGIILDTVEKALVSLQKGDD